MCIVYIFCNFVTDIKYKALIHFSRAHYDTTYIFNISFRKKKRNSIHLKHFMYHIAVYKFEMMKEAVSGMKKEVGRKGEIRKPIPPIVIPIEKKHQK